MQIFIKSMPPRIRPLHHKGNLGHIQSMPILTFVSMMKYARAALALGIAAYAAASNAEPRIDGLSLLANSIKASRQLLDNRHEAGIAMAFESIKFKCNYSNVLHLSCEPTSVLADGETLDIQLHEIFDSEFERRTARIVFRLTTPSCPNLPQWGSDVFSGLQPLPPPTLVPSPNKSFRSNTLVQSFDRTYRTKQMGDDHKQGRYSMRIAMRSMPHAAQCELFVLLQSY